MLLAAPHERTAVGTEDTEVLLRSRGTGDLRIRQHRLDPTAQTPYHGSPTESRTRPDRVQHAVEPRRQHTRVPLRSPIDVASGSRQHCRIPTEQDTRAVRSSQRRMTQLRTRAVRWTSDLQNRAIYGLGLVPRRCAPTPRSWPEHVIRLVKNGAAVDLEIEKRCLAVRSGPAWRSSSISVVAVGGQCEYTRA